MGGHFLYERVSGSFFYFAIAKALTLFAWRPSGVALTLRVRPKSIYGRQNGGHFLYERVSGIPIYFFFLGLGAGRLGSVTFISSAR